MRYSLIFRHLLATHFSSGSTALIDDLEMQAAPSPRDNEARRLRSGGLRRAQAQRPGSPTGRCPTPHGTFSQKPLSIAAQVERYKAERSERKIISGTFPQKPLSIAAQVERYMANKLEKGREIVTGLH